MLRLENVSKFYVNNNVTSKGLDNINLTLSKNEIVAITGESGSGKSTLLNVLTKIDSFDEGEIYYKGNETSYFSINEMEQFRKNKIGFIFQNYNIIESYTVLENVMVPMLINGVSELDAKERAKELIKKVGLEKRMNNRGTALSGGEKQRCVIARALASDSEILACDEPTGNLDSKTSKEIIELIKEVSKDKLVLIVSHNFDELKGIATRKIKLHDGRIIEDYKIEDVKDDLDEEVELDLDYVPMKRKVDFNIAMKNLKSTPRKTLFSFIIFLVISAMALILFQYIIYATTYSDYYTNSFAYTGDNKLILYDEDNKPLDKEKVKDITDNFLVNPFYETSTLSFIGVASYYDNGRVNFAYEKNIPDIKLDLGRMPEADNEVILVAPDDYYSYYLDCNITYRTFLQNFTYKIVGFQTRNDVATLVLTGNDKVESLFRIAFLSTKVRFENRISFQPVIDLNRKTEILTSNKARVVPTNIYYGKYKLIDESKIKVNDIPEDSEYENMMDFSTTFFVIGSDFVDLIEEEYYEVSIYGNPSSMARKASRLGYKTINPKTYSLQEPLEKFATNIMSYFYVFLASLSMILIYFITYLIISRIYVSKRETYAIFRTLGVTKKDMNKVVRYEVMLQSIISSVLVFFIFFILGKTVDNEFLKIFKNIDIFVIIWYFIILLGLGLLLAKRFNRKLFSFTVNTTIKAGGIND